MRMSPRGNDSVVWEEVMPAEREAAQGCCLGGVGLSFGFSGQSIQFSVFFTGDVREESCNGQ